MVAADKSNGAAAQVMAISFTPDPLVVLGTFGFSALVGGRLFPSATGGADRPD